MKKQSKSKPVQKLELIDLASDKCLWSLPYESGSVKKINCHHRLEYVPAKSRIAVMEEFYRILEVGGELNVIVCYWTSPRAIQDPSLEWPPFCEQSFLYFNKGWREQQKLEPIRCDFDFGYGYQVDPETASRNGETQAFWIKHYVNTVNDLQLTLTKRGIILTRDKG